jgi:hypothetical protein
MSASAIITALTNASAEEMTTIRGLLAVPTTPVKAPRVKVPAAPKKALPMPEGEPTAEDYRMAVASIDLSVCVGRDLKDGEDKRFKPIVYRESQCGKAIAEDGLCKVCAKRNAKYEETGKPGPWNGRVTEDPLDSCHMLGTAWAETSKPVFGAGSAAVSEAGSVASAKEVEKTEKAAAKEAEKAAKAAAKEAEKAAKAAAKEAEKAAKKAEKEAEKAAKAKKTPAKTTKKPTVGGAVAAAAPVSDAGELLCVEGTVYMVKNGNVFEYDEMSEATGDFVGRLNTDKTIDADGEQVESDTD